MPATVNPASALLLENALSRLPVGTDVHVDVMGRGAEGVCIRVKLTWPKRSWFLPVRRVYEGAAARGTHTTALSEALNKALQRAESTRARWGLV